MVYNSACKSQKYTDSYQQEVWIEFSNDSISIVQNEKLYTSVFGEGDRMEVTMDPASTDDMTAMLYTNHEKNFDLRFALFPHESGYRVLFYWIDS